MTNNISNRYRQLSECWYNAGEVLEYNMDLESAENCYKVAIEYDRNNYRSMRSLVRVLHLQDKYQEADLLLQVKNKGMIYSSNLVENWLIQK
ncbi:MAG: hypothetical protein ACXAD7_20770 [Candidatus Kariarchaeaceae archaeon]|jgi:Tfp pilus assembly protein PilF